METWGFVGELTHVDLFAGIGGFRIAVQRAAESLNLRYKCVLSSDINEGSGRTYSRYFGESYTHGDIRTLSAKGLPLVSILTAGFPCQPFSSVNTIGKKGNDHKSGLLYLEMLRVISECTPQVVLLENVPGFTRMDDGAQLDEIIDFLQKHDYSIAWAIRGADHVVPQLRRRFYLLAEHMTHTFPMISLPKSQEPVSRPTLAQLLDPIDRINPLLFLGRDNWTNQQTKATFKPQIINRADADLPTTLVTSLLANGHKGGQDILIEEPNYYSPRTLSIGEMVRIMGLPEHLFRWNISRTMAHTQLGNSIVPGVVTPIIAHSLGKILKW